MRSHTLFRQVGSKRRVISWICLIVCVGLVTLVFLSGIRFFKVPSRSMEPTLYPGDFIVARQGSEYHRGDVVVFRDPDNEAEYLVKRIVGVGGDIVEVQGGAVFLNDRYASEPYRHSPIDYFMDSYMVPEGEFFMLGDHSNWSIDSHNWGATTSADSGEDAQKGTPRSIPAGLVIGRVVRVYLPLDRQGPVTRYPLRGMVAL